MKDSEYRQQLMQLIQIAYPEGLPHGCQERGVINISFQDGKLFTLKFDKADFACHLMANKSDAKLTENDQAFLKGVRIMWEEGLIGP